MKGMSNNSLVCLFIIIYINMWSKYKGYKQLAERRFNSQVFVVFWFLLGLVGVRY